MEKIKLLALFGESSAGKDSIQHWLTSTLKNTHEIISYTTRPKRDYEKNGKEYYFISDEEFMKLFLKNEFLETSVFNKWFYGTSKKSLNLDKLNIGVFNPQGIRSLLSHSDIINVLPVWIQSYDKERLLRSLKREISPNCEEICRRFLADKEDFKNIDFEHEIFLNNEGKDNYYGFLNRPKILNFLKGQK